MTHSYHCFSQFCFRIHTDAVRDKEEGLDFNSKYHSEKQLFVFCMLLRRLFCRRTGRTQITCSCLFDRIVDSVINIIIIYILKVFNVTELMYTYRGKTGTNSHYADKIESGFNSGNA
jgi:hypothetical protein